MNIRRVAGSHAGYVVLINAWSPSGCLFVYLVVRFLKEPARLFVCIKGCLFASPVIVSPLRTITDVLQGVWKLQDFKVNGHNVLKKVDQTLWLWYTKHGPMWYISDNYVEDGGSWEKLRCLARIEDANGSPTGNIYIPYQSKEKANWMLSAGVYFLPKMSHSLVQRWELLKRQYLDLQEEMKKLKAENEQLQLQLQQYEMTHAEAGLG